LWMYREVLPSFFLLTNNRRGRFLHQHLTLISLSGLFLKNYAIFQSFFGATNFVLFATKGVTITTCIFERSTKSVCTQISIKRI
jgi:hypothetical protein